MMRPWIFIFIIGLALPIRGAVTWTSWWKFEEVGTRTDVFGTNHLSPNSADFQVSSPWSTAGKITNATKLVRADQQYLFRRSSTSLSPGDVDMSFVGWVRLTTIANDMDIIGKFETTSPSNQREYRMDYQVSSARFRWIVSGDGIASTVLTINFSGIQTNVWYFFAVGHSSVSNIIWGSINNNPRNTAAHTTGIFQSSTDFNIGRRGPTTGNQYLNGDIDEVGLALQYIEDADLTAIYNGGTGITFAPRRPQVRRFTDLTDAGVREASDSSTDGDVLLAPSGTWAVSNAVALLRGLVFRPDVGASVTIKDFSADAQGDMLQFRGSASNFTRMAYFNWTNGNRSSGSPGFNGALQISGVNTNGSRFRFDHMTFHSVHNNDIKPYTMIGVIDHNSITTTGAEKAIETSHDRWNGWNNGDASWNTEVTNTWDNPDYWVMIEDNSFTNTTAKGPATDSNEGARYQFRFNTNRSVHCVVHGADSSNGDSSTRAVMVYGNVGTTAFNISEILECRGGNFLVFSNRYELVNDRSTDADYYRDSHTAAYWDGADGTNGFDVNLAGGPFQTGTHTGTNGSPFLSDNSKAWTNNGLVGFSIINTSWTNRFSRITSNTDTNLFVDDDEFDPTRTMVFNTGNTYEIYKVLRAVQQPGVGTGAIPANRNILSPPPYTWWNFVDEICYSWANTNTLTGNPALASSAIPWVLNGTHYTNAAPPFSNFIMQYPHPLVIDTVDIVPAATNVTSGAGLTFAGSGGSGTYIWFEFVTNNSGATLDTYSGVYTAGPTPATDTVRLWDSYGNYDEGAVTVDPPPPTAFPTRRRILQ